MRIAVAGGTGTVGRYVVALAEALGHQVVTLARSRGVNVRTGAGLDEALAGVETVVDVTNPGAAEHEPPAEFFTDVARCLQDAAARHGVQRVVTLSIVGIDRRGTSDNPYYAAKLRQEQAVLAGPVPAFVLRATQFHEFPAQMLRTSREGSVAHVPNVRVQTVAARSAAQALVDLLEGTPAEAITEVAGPEPAQLVDLARAFARRWGPGTTVLPVDSPLFGPGMDLLPSPGALIRGPAFADWLESDDAASMAHGASTGRRPGSG